jgi:hypothetical protein
MIRIALAAVLVFSGSSTTLSLGNESDGLSFLNMALSQSADIAHNGERVEFVEEHTVRDGGFPGPIIHYETVVPYVYAGKPSAASAEVVSVKSIVYDEPNTVQLPAKAIMARVRYNNCGEMPYSIAQSVTLSGTKGWSFTKTDSIQTGVSLMAEGSFSIGGIGARTSVSTTITTSSARAVGETKSEAESRMTNIALEIPVGKRGEIFLMITEGAARIPYSAEIVFDGPLISTARDYKRASELLSEQQRTFTVRGWLEVTGVSDIETNNQKSQLPVQCQNTGDWPLNGAKIEYLQMAADSLDAEFAAGFSEETLGSALERAMAVNFIGDVVSPDDGVGGGAPEIPATAPPPSIGSPPDGMSYRVLGTSTIVRPYPACGYNDVSLPNPALFTIETRIVEHHAGGLLVSSYQEIRETFTSCVSGP